MVKINLKQIKNKIFKFLKDSYLVIVLCLIGISLIFMNKTSVNDSNMESAWREVLVKYDSEAGDSILILFLQKYENADSYVMDAKKKIDRTLYYIKKNKELYNSIKNYEIHNTFFGTKLKNKETGEEERIGTFISRSLQ